MESNNDNYYVHKTTPPLSHLHCLLLQRQPCTPDRLRSSGHPCRPATLSNRRQTTSIDLHLTPIPPYCCPYWPRSRHRPHDISPHVSCGIARRHAAMRTSASSPLRLCRSCPPPSYPQPRYIQRRALHASRLLRYAPQNVSDAEIAALARQHQHSLSLADLVKYACSLVSLARLASQV